MLTLLTNGRAYERKRDVACLKHMQNTVPSVFVLYMGVLREFQTVGLCIVMNAKFVL
jgi:hypothetical protein